MKKETVDEIVGRALRGEPYVPTGDEDVLVSAQPAALQCVAYAELPEYLTLAVDRWFAENTGMGGCSDKDVRELAALFYGVHHSGGRESLDDALEVVESFGPEISGLNDTYARQILLADEVKRLRAAHGQAPACKGSAGECTFNGACMYACGAAPAAGITVEQVEDAIGLQSTAWDTIGAEKIVEAVLRLANGQAPAGATNTKTHALLSTMIGLFLRAKEKIGYQPGSAIDKTVAEAVEHLKDWPYPETATAQAAPAAGAVAGPGWKLVPVEPTDYMLRAIRNQRSGGRVGAGDRADWAAWLATAPTPAAQANSQPAPQGETNVQLDTDSNSSAPGQQRDAAGSVALGQPMGNGQDQAAGHSGAQGDKLLTVAERNIRSFLRSAVFKSESDREAALSCVDVLRDAARAPADSVLDDAHALLQEVAACFTRDDDLPDNLLPRIDAVLKARKQGGAQ